MSLLTFSLVVAFVFGITIGSFLNVVIWRLPRGGSIADPQWSYCPRCEHRLEAVDLVPVFSFLFLGRRCRHCKEGISWRYPAIELLTGLLFMAVVWRFGPTVDSIFYCLFTAALICVFFIDLEHYVIPDGLNLTAGLIGLAHNMVATYLGERGQWVHVGSVWLPASLIGGAAYAAIIYGIGFGSYVYFVGIVGKQKSAFAAGWEYIKENVMDWAFIGVYYAGKIIPPLAKYAEPPPPLEGTTAEEIESDEEAGGMGGGDGKLAAAIGANLYMALALQSLLWAIVLGAFFGIAILIKQRRSLGGRTAIPFGPWMVTGALIALFMGNSLVNWYYKTYIAPLTAPMGAPSGAPQINSQK